MASLVVIYVVINVLEPFLFLFSKYVALGKCNSLAGM